MRFPSRRRRRRFLHALRVRGHAVDPVRMYAMDWIRGALLVGWALVIGGFIINGGTDNFRAETYRALVETFPWPAGIGGVLLTGGLMGMAGVWCDIRWLSQTSCIVCALWHGTLFGFTIPANLGQFGNSNLVGPFALLVGLLYVVQLLEVSTKPSDRDVTR